MSKPQLIVHVGMHKTGTSWLQLWLHANRAGLSSRGVLYPEHYMKFPNANHHLLADHLRDNSDFTQVADELAALVGDHDSVVLSSETFSSLFHRARSTAAQFHAAYSRHFRIRIVVYLRRQDDMIESVYAEEAKTKRIPAITEMVGRPMNWNGRLAYMADIFGAEAIRARPFLSKAWLHGHLGADFLRAAGLPALKAPIDVPRVNESMPRRKTLFMAGFDKAGLPNGSEFIEMVRNSRAIADDGVRFLLSPADRQALVEHHRRTNIKLCERFIGRQWADYFTTLPDDHDSWTPAEPVSVAEHNALVAELWTRAMRAEHALRKPAG